MTEVTATRHVARGSTVASHPPGELCSISQIERERFVRGEVDARGPRSFLVGTRVGSVRALLARQPISSPRTVDAPPGSQDATLFDVRRPAGRILHPAGICRLRI